MKKIVWTVLSMILLFSSSAFAYTPQRSDTNVWYELAERLIDRLKQANWSKTSYDTMIRSLVNAKARIQGNEKYAYIMSIPSDTVYDMYQKYQNEDYFTLLQSFRAKHDATMQSAYDQPNNLTTCFKHYPLVDEYARKTNKPTPLILAMWYIESSCAMKNPDNRDGLFQIINNDYAPGVIDRGWLESQLNDFARFMDSKWAWYYSRNPKAPRELWYTSFTYDALQTFAALYNGIDLKTWIYTYPLLNGAPYYFLGNYSAEYKGKRDWLLVFFLKLSKLEAEYFGK
jgi:hypothetical protein